MMPSSIASRWGIEISKSGSEFLSSEIGIDISSEKMLEKYLLESDFKQMDQAMFSSNTERYPVLVQVGKAVDISKPIGPEEEDDGEEKVEEMKSSKQRGYRGGGGAKRLLRIIAFSVGGSQRMELLELAPMSHIPTEMTPGTKILLKSPLRAVGGYHLLTSRGDIEIVGGRVDRLARSYDMGKQVKESRGQQTAVGGPPKFVSFFDRDKKTRDKLVKPSPPVATSKVTDTSQPSTTRVIDVPAVSRSDKVLHKLETDVFAMKQKGERKFERRSKRRDQDELLDQYKPPSRTAPQLSAFARVDKCDSLVGAQLLADAAENQQPRESRGKGNANRGKGGKGSYSRNAPKR
jgi:hypothetical protein